MRLFLLSTYFASKLLFSWNLNSVEFKTFIDYLEQEKSKKNAMKHKDCTLTHFSVSLCIIYVSFWNTNTNDQRSSPIDLVKPMQNYLTRGHSSITSSRRWVGGVKKWKFLMIYSTVNHQRVGWVGLKKSKTWWRNTWRRI